MSLLNLDNLENDLEEKTIVEEEEEDGELYGGTSEERPNLLSPSSAVHGSYSMKSPILKTQAIGMKEKTVEPEKNVEVKETDVDGMYYKKYCIDRKNLSGKWDRAFYRFTLPSRYEPTFLLGEGAYGFVLCCDDKVANIQVAVKIIELYQEDPFKKKRRKEAKYHKNILREILILKHFIGCENIVSLLDIYLVNSDDNEIKCDGNYDGCPSYNYDTVVVVLELMDRDLYHKIIKEAPLEEKVIKQIIYDTLKGLMCLHTAKVFHRDVKPQNLLLTGDKTKICDFGLSRGMDFMDKLSTTNIITRWYRSPEVCLMYENASHVGDVWSTGCILAELISGKKHYKRVLFPGEGWVDQIAKIVQIRGTPKKEDMFGHFSAIDYVVKNLSDITKKDLKDIFPDASDCCLDLLDSMLEFNPFKRISAEEALKHDFFKELYEDDVKNKSDSLFKKVDSFKARISDELSTDQVRELFYVVVVDWQKIKNPKKDFRKMQFLNKNVIMLGED